MLRTPLLAFVGVAALSALAFAPLVSPGTGAGADGKAKALAAGELDLSDSARSAAIRAAEELSLVDCTAGMAGPFHCNNVDLKDVVPTAAFGGAHGSDSWGWTADDGTEIAIVTSGYGVGFFRIGEDGTAGYLGTLELSHIENPANSGGYGILWHDVKVVNDHAYITAEDSDGADDEAAQYGIQIVDLNRVADLPASDPTGGQVTIEQDGFVDEGLAGHNMVGFPERDLIGIVLGEHNECGGNLVFYDVADTPTEPREIGCAWPEGHLDYLDTPHDAHCVVYQGPDPDYNGAGADRELGTADDTEPHDICALFNQYDGGMILVDTTALTRDRSSNRAEFVNRFMYDTLNYAHQGWFTENHRWVIWGDELDESGALAQAVGAAGPGLDTHNQMTTTYWVDVSDLDVLSTPAIPGDTDRNIDLVKKWSNPNTIAIDHNLYPKDNLLYQANYGAGLRVLEFSDESLAGEPADAFEEVAYFDTYPGPGPSEFYGAWNVYPFFESGNIILSDFQSGLLVLDVDEAAIDGER